MSDSKAYKFGEKLGKLFRPKSNKIRDAIGYTVAVIMIFGPVILFFGGAYVITHFVVKYW